MRTHFKGTIKALVLIGFFFLTGCGSSGGSSFPLGKLPGGVTGGVPGFGGGGCVPIQAPIPFSGQNIHFDHYNLVGGNLPPTDAWPIKPEGMVSIGGGIAPGGGFGGVQLYGSGPDGQLQITATPMVQQQALPPGGTTYPGSYPYSNPYTYSDPLMSQRGNVGGSLTLSPQTQQEIMMYLGAYNVPQMPYPGTYPGTYPQQPMPQQVQACASGVAFNMGYQVNMPYGKMYLYLNNTPHGITLVF